MPRTSSPSPTASRRTVATDGVQLTFETVPALEDAAPPLRISPDETTLLRVVSGAVRLTVGGVERLLGVGDEAIVRPGEPHRIAGFAGEARVVMGFRAAPLP
jgi:mannose-6-phosphate isomerase-like protein (cupin superfamily)